MNVSLPNLEQTVRDGAANWNFDNLCGDEGFQIWNKTRNDIGICFQQLVLDIPVLSLLAITSSYYVGYPGGYVSRGSIQIFCIHLRCLLTMILALIPLIQIYIFAFKTTEKIPQVAYLLSAVQGLTWLVHLFYNLGLRKKLGVSPRGPMFICILWSMVFVLTVVSVRSHFFALKYALSTDYSAYLAFGISISYLIVHVFYGLSMIPGKGETTLVNITEVLEQMGENQPLLRNEYLRFRVDNDRTYLGVAMEDASWYSKLTFGWVKPLMQEGVQEKLLTTDDLHDLPLSINCRSVGEALQREIAQENAKQLENSYCLNEPGTSSDTTPLQNEVEVKTTDFTLVKALHKVFWVEFYTVGILKFVGDCANFAGPMLLNKLITFIEDKNESIGWGYLYAGGLLSTTLIAALCDSQFNFYMAIVGYRMRGSLVTTIYKKILSLSPLTLRNNFSLGEIVNFMSTDTDRIVNACPSFHSLWNIPFQLVVTLYLLYLQMGLAFLAGVAFSVVLIPINKVIANKIGDLSSKLMEKKDGRVKILAEVLRGIKAIKLYVWEDHFMRQITRLRSQELKYLKGRKYLDALCVFFWATTPVLISILTFVTYVLLGNKLTAAKVFTSIALLNMLIAPLNAFPWVLNGMMEAWVSVKRIQKLLKLADLNLISFYGILSDHNYDIVLDGASFNYGKEFTAEEQLQFHGEKPTSRKGKGLGKTKKQSKKVSFGEINTSVRTHFSLTDLNLKVRQGEFIGIIGAVGCGKSSVLSAIMAELPMRSGEVAISQIESGFGIVTQQAWLQRGTVRENILFGKPFDEQKYKDVIFACGLTEDILSLSNGDMTGVGEGGMTLSGGQKARVALARAVYQDKSVYLLDDILSAVDTNVAKHIFQYCILGLLREKTKVLCTHHVQFLAYTDWVIYMERGTIKKQGKPTEILSDIDDCLVLDLELGESVHSYSSGSLLDSIKEYPSSIEAAKDNDSLLNSEISKTGSLSFDVYTSYWKAVGHLVCLSILIALFLMQISRNMTDLWLAHWVSNDRNCSNSSNITTDYFTEDSFIISDFIRDSQETTSFYLKIYILLAVANTLFTLFRAFLFAYGGIVAASKFHKLLLKSVVKAQAKFFDVTPIGRILNRFSSDTYTVDDSLPFVLNILLAQFFGLLGSLGVTIYGLPWICIFLVPLVPVYHWLQNYYRFTSRQLKRISSVTLSPVYSHFNETLQGLTIIKAMRADHRFRRENQDHIDSNLKAQFASQAASRWLGLRLQFIGVAIVAGVSFIAVVQHQYAIADPGLIGLVISYALTITGLLRGVIQTFTETEQEMIAVERISQYLTGIPEERSYSFDTIDPPFGWPSQGVVTFNKVVLKYRKHLSASLDGVSFETRPSEKIGVVGRTGAGKSSIISALFRIADLTSGEICVDSVNISRVSLSILRSRLFCIPQDPFMFSGTLKENLDPLGEFRDDEIWRALAKVNLDTVIKSFGGLCNVVDESGANFSVGQRQLVCLARAILHNAKILCIDEATANVDQETDHLIQKTLRSAFRNSTVLTIAHRIQTVMDSDRVLVVNEGKIVEFDTPERLLENESSYFSRLVRSNDV